jgi:hypothetical protein
MMDFLSRLVLRTKGGMPRTEPRLPTGFERGGGPRARLAHEVSESMPRGPKIGPPLVDPHSAATAPASRFEPDQADPFADDEPRSRQGPTPELDGPSPPEPFSPSAPANPESSAASPAEQPRAEQDRGTSETVAWGEMDQTRRPEQRPVTARAEPSEHVRREVGPTQPVSSALPEDAAPEPVASRPAIPTLLQIASQSEPRVPGLSSPQTSPVEKGGEIGVGSTPEKVPPPPRETPSAPTPGPREVGERPEPKAFEATSSPAVSVTARPAPAAASELRHPRFEPTKLGSPAIPRATPGGDAPLEPRSEQPRPDSPRDADEPGPTVALAARSAREDRDVAHELEPTRGTPLVRATTTDWARSGRDGEREPARASEGPGPAQAVSEAEPSSPAEPRSPDEDLLPHLVEPAPRYGPHRGRGDQGSERAAPTVVQVSIGRLEVRATQPAKPPRAEPRRPSPRTSLQTYLERRNRGDR